jgi:hypothetical protein
LVFSRSPAAAARIRPISLSVPGRASSLLILTAKRTLPSCQFRSSLWKGSRLVLVASQSLIAGYESGWRSLVTHPGWVDFISGVVLRDRITSRISSVLDFQSASTAELSQVPSLERYLKTLQLELSSSQFLGCHLSEDIIWRSNFVTRIL